MFCIISKRSILSPNLIDELSHRRRILRVRRIFFFFSPLSLPENWAWKLASLLRPAVPPKSYRKVQAGRESQVWTALTTARCPCLRPPNLMPKTETQREVRCPLQARVLRRSDRAVLQKAMSADISSLQRSFQWTKPS